MFFLCVYYWLACGIGHSLNPLFHNWNVLSLSVTIQTKSWAIHPPSWIKLRVFRLSWCNWFFLYHWSWTEFAFIFPVWNNGTLQNYNHWLLLSPSSNNLLGEPCFQKMILILLISFTPSCWDLQTDLVVWEAPPTAARAQVCCIEWSPLARQRVNSAWSDISSPPTSSDSPRALQLLPKHHIKSSAFTWFTLFSNGNTYLTFIHTTNIQS